MKTLSLIFFSVIISVGMMAQAPLPDVEIKDLDGKPVNVKQTFGDKGLKVISFWATWCSPCKKELDAVSDLYPEWKDKYNVEMIAISIDNTRGLPKVRPMVEQKGWDFVILSDVNQDLQRAMNFQTVPQTFLVKDGKVVYSHSGYVPGDEYELEDEIKKHK